MRNRTKMNDLIVSVKPSGESYQSAKNRCEQKLRKLERLLEEGYKITHTEVKKPKSNEFKLFGTFTIEVPMEILIKAGFRK